MLPHPLNNFKIQRNYQNEPKFNDIFSRNNLLVVKTCAAHMEHT